MEVTQPSTDVLVVGGGPAGAAAAIAAVRGGARVTLLEREARPRDRPGETLHPGIEPMLDHLGAGSALHAATLARHQGHWVRALGRRHFVAFGRDPQGEWRGFQANRRTLDAGLRECAAAAGALLRTGVGVAGVRRDRDGRVTGVITTAGGVVKARVVIDAAGGRHWLSRQLGLGVRQLSPRYVATYGYATGNGSLRGAEICAEAEFSADAEGWTWVAPVGTNRWHWTRLQFGPVRMPGGWLPPVLAGLQPAGPSRGADMTWRIARHPVGPGWLLAGDAAAVLDPASSQGVLRALMSGFRAGTAASEACREPSREPQSLAAYRAWLHAGVAQEAGILRASYEHLQDGRARRPRAGFGVVRTVRKSPG